MCKRRVTKALAAEKSISKMVIRLRKKKKLTQIELAERSGLSRKTINEVESGRKNGTSVATLMQLAEALEVTPTELLGVPKCGYGAKLPPSKAPAKAPSKRKKAAPPE